jgi:hypothetical protein
MEMATRVKTTKRKRYQDRDELDIVPSLFKVNLTIFAILV